MEEKTSQMSNEVVYAQKSETQSNSDAIVTDCKNIALKDGYIAVSKNGRLFAVSKEAPNRYLCTNCYTRVDSEFSTTCAYCGTNLIDENFVPPKNDSMDSNESEAQDNEKKFMVGWFILGLLIPPIISAIFVWKWKKTNPGKSRSVGWGVFINLTLLSAIKIISSLSNLV